MVGGAWSERCAGISLRNLVLLLGEDRKQLKKGEDYYEEPERDKNRE